MLLLVVFYNVLSAYLRFCSWVSLSYFCWVIFVGVSFMYQLWCEGRLQLSEKIVRHVLHVSTPFQAAFITKRLFWARYTYNRSVQLTFPKWTEWLRQAMIKAELSWKCIIWLDGLQVQLFWDSPCPPHISILYRSHYFRQDSALSLICCKAYTRMAAVPRACRLAHITLTNIRGQFQLQCELLKTLPRFSGRQSIETHNRQPSRNSTTNSIPSFHVGGSESPLRVCMNLNMGCLMECIKGALIKTPLKILLMHHNVDEQGPVCVDLAQMWLRCTTHTIVHSVVMLSDWSRVVSRKWSVRDVPQVPNECTLATFVSNNEHVHMNRCMRR